MKQLSEKYPPVLGIPAILGVVIVGVEPTIIAVVFDIEHIQIAVRVGIV